MPRGAATELVGRMLAGRYLLHSPIGTGASGRVYVADDTRLRRRVAVKVLHAALADDAAFLRRFRAEAQLAASLSHPNIVTVYDWGEDEVPFMVLELLVGGSLRTMLDQGTLLTVAQAAHVGKEVASALEYAHGRDVLHRDIKPANLLFDEHGVARVADFGLARALAEASWTEPAGGVLGTARYASPEQATGVQLDARSDLYSLALVLVESVTGRLPFAADTTLGTLTARTQRSLIAPESLGSLAAVIDRAGRLDPAERYPDAGTMRQALSDVADSLPPPGPLMLAGMDDSPDPHPTRVVVAPPPDLFDQDATRVAVEPVPVPSRPKGQRRLVPFVVAAVLVATVALAASAFARVGGGHAVAVPGFVGLTQTAAATAARTDGITVTIARQSAPDATGVVIGQTPGVGSWTTSHSVQLIVSSGPAPVAVPPIEGEQWKVAQKQLDAIGFDYRSSLQFDNTNTHPAGEVITVTPGPGISVSPENQLRVVVSAGHAPVPLPSVAGLSYADASRALTAAHFIVFRGPDAFSDSIAAGKAIKTSPAFGTSAKYGAQVTVTMSRGPIMAKVPDLRGDTLSEATAELQRDGFTFAINGRVRGNQVVVDQTPPPHKPVPLDLTTIELTFGNSH